MLVIHIPESEVFDEETSRFLQIKATTLRLEHSLLSISKWESKYHKPFLSKESKTVDEMLDYIRFMSIDSNVPENVLYGLTQENQKKISEYIEDPMTATQFYGLENKGRSRETITSELIYYWMIAQQVPMECQKWHLNRLITLITLCGIKNEPPKKMSRKGIMSRNQQLNAQRRAKYNSKG